MKKRLLSAALALAMALTLLPMSVFAADPTTGTGDPDTAVTVTRQVGDATDGRQNGHWYWTDTRSGSTVYKEVSTGYVSGVSGSGTWYNASATNGDALSIYDANGKLKTTSFTLLSTPMSVDCEAAGATSLTVNVNDGTLNLSNITKLGTLTVTNPWGDATKGTVSGITSNTKSSTAAPVSGLRITASNVNLSAVSLKNGVSNGLTLQGGVTITTLDMDGSNTDAKGNATYAAQSITTSGANVISGEMNITSNGGSFTLNNITGASGAKGGALNLTATGGGVTVAGYSNLGKITVKSTCGATAANVAVPSVTVNGGTVDGIEHDASDTTTASATVTVNGATVTGTDSIKLKSGTVNINAGATVSGAVTVPTGAVNITGGVSGTNVGNIVINASGKTSLRVTGSNVTTGDITASSASNLTVSIPKDLTNKFGVTDLSTYGGNGILGGKFKTQFDSLDEQKYLGKSVKFAVKQGDYWAYYNDNELSQAIAASISETTPAIWLVGHPTTGASKVTLKNSDKTAEINYSRLDSFNLPSVLLGDNITGWTNNADNVPYAADGLYTTPASPAAVTLVGQDAPGQMNATKLNGVSVSTTGQNYTGGIRANLVGNVITLTGAVNESGGYTAIPLTLETDIKDDDGNPVTADVTVVYNSNAKTVRFDMAGYAALAAKSIVLAEESLSMNGGKNVYTLNGSGLGVPAGDLNTATTSTEIQVTVTKSGWNDFQKKALIDKMTGTNATFTWTDIPAVEQAINAAQLTINNNTTINNWITTAQNAVWRYGNKTGTTGFNGKGDGTLNPHTTSAPTDTQRAAATSLTTKYAAVWLVPYLQVTVTDVNETTGYMTLTLTPSYRVDVSASGTYAATEYYTVQAGRTLGAITGDMGTGVQVKFGTLGTPFTTAWMHQDNAYAYQATTGTWTITHGSSNGLGSMLINTTKPVIKLTQDSTDTYYDSLQAAVDDTKYHADAADYAKIEVGENYGGNGVISVTGEARTFEITVKGNTKISASASGDLVKVTDKGRDYTVQLLKDTAAAGQNIVVGTATGGTASVNANPAKAGSTVTITLSANAGYTPNGVTVRTSGGQNVSVSGSGSTYTFTMPASGTVTVTPAFKTASTTATVSVSGNSYGTATTTAGNSQVAQGTPVTVSVAPYRGYRTMGLSVTGATATRTGVNQFTFTVPSGYTNVTVTPSFDVDNNTPFSDVWSNRYYSNPIAWAYTNGYTRGATTYTYEPARKCTRAEMVTFLWQAAGSPTGNYSNPFSDVSANNWRWAYNAILWAAHQGLIETNTGKFNPTANITRADVVQILYKRAGSPNYGTRTGFNDVASNSKYARAVTWAHNKGITDGYGDPNRFAPAANITREEVATMLYRAFK